MPFDFRIEKKRADHGEAQRKDLALDKLGALQPKEREVDALLMNGMQNEDVIEYMYDQTG